MEIKATKFRDVIDPLTEDEQKGLEADLLENDGPNDPIWVWGVHIVDGHHRYDICRLHDLPFKTRSVWDDLTDEDDVRGRMQMLAANQRNLSAEQQRKYRVKAVYQLSKNKAESEAIEQVAKNAGIASRTVYRDLKKHELGQQLTEELKDADFVYQRIGEETLELMGQLEPAVQIEIAERNGYEASKIAKDVIAQKSVAGSPVFDAVKAKKKERQQKVAAKRETRSVLQNLVADLAHFKKSALKVRKKAGVSDGAWSRMETAMDAVAVQLEEWKELFENDGSGKL